MCGGATRTSAASNKRWKLPGSGAAERVLESCAILGKQARQRPVGKTELPYSSRWLLADGRVRYYIAVMRRFPSCRSWRLRHTTKQAPEGGSRGEFRRLRCAVGEGARAS